MATGFALLRNAHPNLVRVIHALEAQLTATLAVSPQGLVEDVRLVQQLRVSEDVVRVLLAELVRLGFLRPLLLWRCPRGLGTAAESFAVGEFPPRVDCNRCGFPHDYDPADVERCFVATERLLASLRVVGPRAAAG